MASAEVGGDGRRAGDKRREKDDRRGWRERVKVVCSE